MYLLDTDILVGLLRNNARALHKIKSFADKKVIVYTSPINIHEVVVGAYLSQNPEKNFEKVKVLILSLNILAFDEQSAYLSGRLYAERMKKGKMIEQNDLFIAALALVNNLILVTKNIKHFEGIEGLEVEEW